MKKNNTGNNSNNEANLAEETPDSAIESSATEDQTTDSAMYIYNRVQQRIRQMQLKKWFMGAKLQSALSTLLSSRKKSLARHRRKEHGKTHCEAPRQSCLMAKKMVST